MNLSVGYKYPTLYYRLIDYNASQSMLISPAIWPLFNGLVRLTTKKSNLHIGHDDRWIFPHKRPVTRKSFPCHEITTTYFLFPGVHGTSIAREDDPLAAGASGAPQYGRAPQAYQGGGSGASGAGFRPINFRPPLGSQNRMNMGVFESTTAAQPWNPSTPSVTSSHSADGSAGYCDLWILPVPLMYSWT